MLWVQARARGDHLASGSLRIEKEVAAVFEVTAGRKRRMNVSVNSFCVNFILWGYLITIG